LEGDEYRLQRKSVRAELAPFLLFIIIVILVIGIYYLVSKFNLPLAILYYFIITKLNLISYAMLINVIIRIALIFALFLPVLHIVFRFVSFTLRKRRGQKISIGFSLCEIRFHLLFTLGLTLLILASEFLLPVYLLVPVKNSIDSFVENIQLNNRNHPSTSAVVVIGKVAEYVNSSLSSSWSRLEAALEIDNMLSDADYAVLRMLGFHVAHVIFFQKWGFCGEYAIATAYLLDKLGFETRIARFDNIDHSWAEVKLNNSWFIVDPWYIGKRYENELLVPASKLSSLFPEGLNVIVAYFNGTEVNTSKEHGYS